MITFSTGPQRLPVRVLLCVVIALAGCEAQATALEFDARFLQGESAPATDVSRFQHSDAVPEGDQSLDVVINENWSGRWSVPLRRHGEDLQASPCYTGALLQALAVDSAQFAASVREQLQPADSCLPLSALGLEASERLDFAGLRLTLQIAQQALLHTPRDYLPPEQWDSGVSVAFIDYRLNLFSQQSRTDEQRWNQSFLGVRSGVNTGAWYWRHEGNLQAGEGIERHYQPVATYVQRDVPAWHAQLTLGQAYSRGEVFDSIAYLGLGLGSDERMLPASQRGFAPTVSGVAYSTALLTIRQRGVVIHESTVQPGPFEISDLYANGFSDDLQVTLREADGNQRTFTVPYQVAPLALRPGASRFDFSLGRWRDGLGDTGPEHVQGSWQQGLNNRFSVHAGLLGAEGYQSGALGATMNSRLGAVALTLLQSHTDLAWHEPSGGQALRLSWRQVMTASMTDLSANLTSSDLDYYAFNDVARAQRDSGRNLHDQARARLRASLAVSQGVGGQGGRLRLQTTRTQYWRQAGSDLSYSLGYFNHYGSLGYGVTASREQYSSSGRRNHVGLTLSLPLGETRRSSLSSSLNSDGQGQRTTSTRLSSTAGEYGEWGYGLGLTSGQDERRSTAGLDANLLYAGPVAEISGALTHHSDYRQASLGVRGGLVGHAGGLTAAPSLGESFAIVHAPGAAHARLKQAPQVRLDRRGYGVLPQLTPYSLNTVELDPKGTSQDVELQISSQQVVPRAGAAPLLYYPTRSGRSAVIDARLADGGALPFAAQVLDESGDELGMVGQGSRLHVRGVNQQGRLQVRWGDSAQQKCLLNYQMPDIKPAGSAPMLLIATCEQPPGDDRPETLL
ncbi:fimbria/pilus outer membrane usher protein [Pseudomonas putida]|uniref:fimbria/pilus outer membrane usher protein n=1 Tax=Pseudomonas putida TaxID=303 RepID=UPI0023655B7E|nr:fimbria/pilus outer membrane usher protein [Pseudomonas putida]MDD2046025.1 fimbrial biogenesis outer membrane usher protein [Pseudomonas putida]